MALLARLTALCAALAAAGAACPSPEWQLYRGQCYWFSSFPLEWRSVASVCELQAPGSRPVSVHDVQVNAFLTEQVLQYQSGWLGLRRSDTGRPWVWSDGSVYDWHNWEPLQPHGDGERCALIHEGGTGGWRTADCSLGYYRFICQKDEHPVTTVEPSTTELPTTEPTPTEPTTTEPATTWQTTTEPTTTWQTTETATTWQTTETATTWQTTETATTWQTTETATTWQTTETATTWQTTTEPTTTVQTTTEPATTVQTTTEPTTTWQTTETATTWQTTTEPATTWQTTTEPATTWQTTTEPTTTWQTTETATTWQTTTGSTSTTFWYHNDA
ncbi:salivary glue protein Sgs-3-like [Amphibalanus amphitrite]|uniref:salivary glue protein Sgs-3-like n=1 Tax=Amphibalanus amphitrite TaxID=1232801 RepID=UPI001C918C2A|nr:salivary glue protein Sgs-3-like [Amphibalanus amphitrite]